MLQTTTYRALVERLDQFIRKYYLNQVIRGGLYTLGLVGLCFLAVALLEGNFYFDRVGRKTLFFSFLAVSAAAASYWVLLPLARYFRLGERHLARAGREDYRGSLRGRQGQAAQPPTTRTRGRNADRGRPHDERRERGSVAGQYRPKECRASAGALPTRHRPRREPRYLRYALPPLLLLVCFLVAAPSLITDSTARLVRNNEDFERPAPFRFVLPKGDLNVVQFENYPSTWKSKAT